MKKILASALAATLLLGLLAGCGKPAPAVSPTAAPQVFNGTGDGYGGVITAVVTKTGDKISVKLTGEHETAGIGADALPKLETAINEKGGIEGVDAISGATWTSKGAFYAVQNALDPAANPYPIAEDTGNTENATAAAAFQGLGFSSSGRVGPGKDDTDTPVYSLNQVLANAIFDGEGRILSLYVDQIEVATPNYDGEGMPHFAGFPGQEYNYDENHDEKVDGKLTYNDESFLAEVASWQTKRQRGEGYKLSSSTWDKEMDKFQSLFVGMTVDEVEAWFAKYCSDLNGRPLNITDKSKDEDKAKYAALSDADKAVLADVVSGATMSLKDGHGDVLAAIRSAYDNRIPLTAAKADGFGLGVVTSGRVGPGKDDTDTPVYSLNVPAVSAVFDGDKIVGLYIDQLEVATPNYDGEGMPHFAGFPGQEYNYDENHDEKVDGKLTYNDESFLTEVASWQTKRQRGESYKLSSSTWDKEMDKFQSLFVGMTADEIDAWFAKYCSDLNGRPLNITDKSKDEDKAKYAALSDADKAVLTDVVSGATMSLKDAHGDLLAAIRSAVENRVAISLTVG